MTNQPFAWATHAPTDYLLVFVEDPEGKHAVVTATFKSKNELRDVSRDLEGAEIGEKELSVYCTVPGEADQVLGRLKPSARRAWVECGEIAFVAVGDGEGTSAKSASGRRNVSARVVLSEGGRAPRRYALEKQCATCGEFLGRIHVMPQGAVLLETRSLSCRCSSIPCRYCQEGKVRRPLSEHFDPERRAGSVPWFGYLVPCGNCQAAGRGPDVWMSA